MKLLLRQLLFLFSFFISAPLLFAQPGRKQQLFNDSWRFSLNNAGAWQSVQKDDSHWRVLNLPHDWSIEGDFSKDHPATPGGGALPGGVGWYRKSFTVPLADKGMLISLEFEGIYHRSEVWINGHYLGRRPNGYISFRYDLTPYLKYGTSKNLIAVKVDNSQQPNSRWYSGSGIYRNVWLITTPQVHVARYGSFITTPRVSTEEATVSIQTQVTNGGQRPARVATLETTVLDPHGKEVGKTRSEKRLAPGGGAEFRQSLKIAAPELWSVLQPSLYRAVSRVYVDGKAGDRYETRFGIRDFKFDVAKGFFLNGEPLKIRGVCNHHDLGALGTAFNRRAAERQLQILKEMGCNGIRTSHNPPAPELLDLCDEMGFIVMDEAFDIWKKQKNPFDYHLDWDQWHRKDLEDLIKRDRNHPSVFIWSVGNEIQEQWGDEKKGDTTGRVIARELVSIVRSLDTTRAITSANNEINVWNNLLKSNAFAMVGYNYNHKSWASFPERWPGKQFIVTESTSALATRGHYDLVPFDTIRRWPEAWDKPIKGGGNKDFTVSAYDHVSAPWGSTHEESLKELKRNAHVSGMFVWTGFDYLGEPTPYPWPARSSYFGIIDLAGFPKDVYYLYQSEWTDSPVLHLYPHWNWERGDTVDVVAYYNNADEVELFLNGQSLGRKKKEDGNLHVKWRVPFSPGVLKAVSYKDTREVLVKEVRTAGKPAKVRLLADRSSIKADGRDLSFVTVSIVDAEGNLVPDAKNSLHFTVTGRGSLNAVDNGDPTSHERFKASNRKAFNGLALAIIQSTTQSGKIKLRAEGEGIAAAELEIVSK